MAESKMVCEIDGTRYEKSPKGSTINLYNGDFNFNCFTDYSIGADFEKFEQSCQEHHDYMTKEIEE